MDERFVERGEWTIRVRGTADFDALVEGFLAGGIDAIGSVPGAWALVARCSGDERAHVAVDAFAGVPLFVSRDESWFGAPPIQGALDRVELHQHLHAAFLQPWRTWMRGVSRIPGGHGGTVGTTVRLRSIYKPRGNGESVRDALERVTATIPASSWLCLSGGLDSSVLASLLTDPIAFTARFPGWDADESEYSEAVVRLHSLRHELHDARADSPGDVFEALSDGFPPVLGNHHLHLPAMAKGRVVVTGFGGDEVIGHGFDVVREAIGDHRFVDAAKQGLGLARRYRHRPESPLSAVARWFREGVRAYVSPPSRATIANRAQQRFRSCLLHRSREEQMRLAQSRGCRLIHPFLDPRVVATTVDLPARARIDNGRTRAHLRAAFASELPQSVRERTTKTDLSRTLWETLPLVHRTYRKECRALVDTGFWPAWLAEEPEPDSRGRWTPDPAQWLRGIGAARFMAYAALQ